MKKIKKNLEIRQKQKEYYQNKNEYSCQDIFNENHKNIKKKLKKHLNKNVINEITDNMCDDFNKAVNNILPEYDDFDLDELLSIDEPKFLFKN